MSAPTEMKSTPVSAIPRTVSIVTPPDASTVARDRTRYRANRYEREARYAVEATRDAR